VQRVDPTPQTFATGDPVPIRCPFEAERRTLCEPPKPRGVCGSAHWHTYHRGHNRSVGSHAVGQPERQHTEACTGRWPQWIVGIPCAQPVGVGPHTRPHAAWLHQIPPGSRAPCHSCCHVGSRRLKEAHMAATCAVVAALHLACSWFKAHCRSQPIVNLKLMLLYMRILFSKNYFKFGKS
jgi:hypothetical protein